MRKTVVIIVLALIPMSLAHAQIPAEERDALILFYYAAGGPGWTNNSGWTSTEGTECSWYGVSCAGGHVYSLSLHDNNLTGFIRPELEDLPNLYTLLLADNRLTGSIPPELGNLSSLANLNLESNRLTGSIPPELGKLTNLSNLHLHTNQLTGSIPPELGSLSKLYGLTLNDNQLTGSIPPSLGNLSLLGDLYLENNQLTGSIPPELGNLTNLNFRLDLSNNQLSGSIPAELGNLTSLKQLFLNENQLSGNIPPEIGDLASVQYLWLHSNKLSGEIPTDLMDLTALVPMNGLHIEFNALYTNDGALIAFLDMVHFILWPWQDVQTIAPENLTVGTVGDHTVWLTWDAVIDMSGPGGYEVFSSPSGFDVWTSAGWTESKSATTFPVTGLSPGMPYDFAVATYTDPHFDNSNLVISDLSTEVTQTTASTPCGQPVIVKTGASPFTLALTESYGTYAWSTGETTANIEVAPTSEQWYWVEVSSPGGCEESAAILVPAVPPVTPSIFSDGFESGNTTEWSSAVP
jgi:hypothetical protein